MPSDFLGGGEKRFPRSPLWGFGENDNNDISDYKSIYHFQHSLAFITSLLSPLKGGVWGEKIKNTYFRVRRGMNILSP